MLIFSYKTSSPYLQLPNYKQDIRIAMIIIYIYIHQIWHYSFRVLLLVAITQKVKENLCSAAILLM